MKLSTHLRKEECVPVGTFLKESFLRDRAELATRFSEFTADYATAFANQLQKVNTLEQPYKLTEDQKKVTQDLYSVADALNKELNFLSFYFKQAVLDPAILTAIKKELNTHNIEGAGLKITSLIEFIKSHQTVLQSKGMAAGFVAELEATKADLEAKNVLQNKIMNSKKSLYEDNRADYEALDEFVKTIAGAGKIFYAGTAKADEYTIAKIISRMRGISKEAPLSSKSVA